MTQARSGCRVVTTGVQRVTSQNAFECEDHALSSAVSFDCIDRILRTRGVESAGSGGKKWRNYSLIEMNDKACHVNLSTRTNAERCLPKYIERRFRSQRNLEVRSCAHVLF